MFGVGLLGYGDADNAASAQVVGFVIDILLFEGDPFVALEVMPEDSPLPFERVGGPFSAMEQEGQALRRVEVPDPQVKFALIGQIGEQAARIDGNLFVAEGINVEKGGRGPPRCSCNSARSGSIWGVYGSRGRELASS